MTVHRPGGGVNESECDPSQVLTEPVRTATRFDKLNAFVDHGQAHLVELGCAAAARLWLTIWRFENLNADSARVALSTLAECYGTDKRNVARMLGQLEERGYLVTLEPGRAGRGSCAVYRLIAVPEKVSPEHLSSAGKGVTTTPLSRSEIGVTTTPIVPEKSSPEHGKGVATTPVQKEQKKNKDKDPPTPPQPGGGSDPAPSEHRSRKTKPDPEADPLFVRFWAAYPRRVKKPQAAAAFAKTKPTIELLEAMLAAIARFARSADWLRDNGQYIPHPTSWLNQRRWEELESPPHTATTTHAPHARPGPGSALGGHRVESQPGKYVRPAAPGLQTRRPIVPGAIRAPEPPAGPGGAPAGVAHGSPGADEGDTPVAVVPLESRTRDRENVGRADAA